jgi:aspartate/methionine/tyrosine aminotransferase
LAYPKLIIGNGFSKSHAITGFRVGYLLCNDQALKNRMLTMQQNLATCVPASSQYALVDAHLADTEIAENAAYYKLNRNLVIDIFPEWEPYKPQGGFYYFIDLQLYGITDAQQFCEKLLYDTGIAVVPGAAYGKGFDSYSRLSFSFDNKLLEEALMKLKNYLTCK